MKTRSFSLLTLFATVALSSATHHAWAAEGDDFYTTAARELAKPQTYMVQQGDTLTKISRQQGISIADLKRFNRLTSDTIEIGHRLVLHEAQASLPARPAVSPAAKPAPSGGHIVEKGDTVERLARLYGVSKAAILKANHLNGDVIVIGQTVKIPGAQIAAKTSAPAEPRAAVKPQTDATLESQYKALSVDDRYRVQVLLDRSLMAPGKVDGALGKYTLLAARRWLKATSHSANEGLDAVLADARSVVGDPYTTYTVQASDIGFVGDVPSTVPEQAAQQFLPYRSLAAFVAERFHTDEAALARLNNGVNLNHLRPGKTVRVPSVKPFTFETLRARAPSSARKDLAVFINYRQNLLDVRSADGVLVAAFPVTLGGKKEHVREGGWEIANRTLFPHFMWDKEMLASGHRGDTQYDIPPGPCNPVGVLWLGLKPAGAQENAHIGIHGTNSAATIGRATSSGCIRLANWDIVRLAELVAVGTPVQWTGDELKLAGLN